MIILAIEGTSQRVKTQVPTEAIRGTVRINTPIRDKSEPVTTMERHFRRRLPMETGEVKTAVEPAAPALVGEPKPGIARLVSFKSPGPSRLRSRATPTLYSFLVLGKLELAKIKQS